MVVFDIRKAHGYMTGRLEIFVDHLEEHPTGCHWLYSGFATQLFSWATSVGIGDLLTGVILTVDLINLIIIYYHIILSKWYASEPSMVPAFKSHCETCANTRVHIWCPFSGLTIAYAHLCACFKQSKRLNACPSLKKASLYWKTMHGRGHLPYLCEDCILNMLGNGNCDAGAPRFIMENIWANYNNSLTWIKAIWGWFPLLTMISSELVVSSL